MSVSSYIPYNAISNYASYYKKICSTKKSQLYFITIKDNTQNSVWTKIGKVNDWIRKISEDYLIVKGLEGGIHFHMLAKIPKDKNIRCPKGIHFNCIQVDKKEVKVPTMDELQDIDKSKHFAVEKKEKMIDLLCIPERCLIISQSIRSYWRKKSNKEKRTALQVSKKGSIDRIIGYLAKNIYVNASDDSAFIQYDTFICKVSN